MTVEELIDTFCDSGLQQFAIYDLYQSKEIYRGPGDELTDERILYREVCSIDTLDGTSDVLTINVEGDE